MSAAFPPLRGNGSESAVREKSKASRASRSASKDPEPGCSNQRHRTIARAASIVRSGAREYIRHNINQNSPPRCKVNAGYCLEANRPVTPRGYRSMAPIVPSRTRYALHRAAALQLLRATASAPLGATHAPQRSNCEQQGKSTSINKECISRWKRRAG